MASEKSPLHKAALEYAAAGFAVFPCMAGEKRPACEHGHKDATTDPAQIDAWWNYNPSYNVAIVPESAGLCVLDLDGSDGAARWDALIGANGKVDTKYVLTPSGKHLYFKGSLPPTASKIGRKIDTRGRNSYVLAPPSVTGKGTYRLPDADLLPAPLPAWVAQAIRDRLPLDKPNRSLPAGDRNAALERGATLLRRYAADSRVAVSGEGGNSRTYAIAAELCSLGVPQEDAAALLGELWNPQCIPPWDEAGLSEIVGNAYRYAQEPARDALPPAQDVFGHGVPAASSLPAVSRFKVLTEAEQAALREPEWLIPDLIPKDSVTMLYGPAGSYKSFLALDMALTLASGIAGWGRERGNRVPVVYCAAEGPRSIARLRRPAWRAVKQIPEGDALPFGLVCHVPFLLDRPSQDEFLKAVEAGAVGHPALVIIDTLSRAMLGMDENAAKDAAGAIEFLGSVQRKLGCSVLVVHHAGKDVARGVRGSSALLAGVDAAHEVKPHKSTRTVEIFCRRQKDADERQAPWTLKGEVFAGSLVFRQIGAEEFRLMASEENLFKPADIGAVLSTLNAFGFENGVTTYSLATQLLRSRPDYQEGSIEDREKKTKAVVVRLRHMFKNGTLSAYGDPEQNGREILWYLPAASLEKTILRDIRW